MTTVKSPLHAVFDTNIFLQAFARPTGPAGACLDAVRADQIRLAISHDLLAELTDVLNRPSIVAKLRLTNEKSLQFLQEVLTLGVLLDPIENVYEHAVDAKDSMIVNLALAAGANIITSRDRHLLALGDLTTAIGQDFHSRFSFIEVLTPVELLERVKAM